MTEVLVNLWMLKAKNGMYWYARDYLARIDAPCTMVLRKGALPQLRDELVREGSKVREVGAFGLLALAALALVSGRLVYTPTPHPIPLLRRQVIVLHDAYPFQGRLGRLKRLMFRAGVKMSGCVVAHINRSVCIPFLAELSLAGSRLLFAPNVPPVTSPRGSDERRHLPVRDDIVLGAFGTDSAKKNYELLLGTPPFAHRRIRLRIYGHKNAYVQALRHRFGETSFDVVSSEEATLDTFIASVDGVVSVAEGEGFGRPLASAIAAGLPCYLLESPSFKEFFEGNACLYASVPALVEGVLREDKVVSSQPHGFLSPQYASAIDSAAAMIRRMAQA